VEIGGAIFALIGGTGILWIAIVVLILFGVKQVPELLAGVKRGGREFLQAATDVHQELRPKETGLVAEALTHDNQSAEFLPGTPEENEVVKAEDLKSKLIVWVAQGFGIGRIPFAPGTWGSVLGVAWSVLLLVAFPPMVSVLFIILSVPLSVWFCGRAEKILGQKDPGSVVLDEIVALPLVYAGLWAYLVWLSAAWEVMPWRKALLTDAIVPPLAGLPNAWPVLLAGFLFFRLFDIWKPWPVRPLQNLRGGWGVVVDDLAAALLANVCLLAGNVAVLKLRQHF
jgi:phosphatidylglycerophosphatase A